MSAACVREPVAFVRAIAALLVLAILLTGCSNSTGQLREFLDSSYEQVDNATVPNAAPDTRTYRSSLPVPGTVDAIAGAVNPSDRTEQPNGTFLRYPGGIVGVVPDDQGSLVTLDDEDTGRTRWFPIIGPVFGLPGGRGATGVRGGGPGFGK